MFVSWHDANAFAEWIGGRLPTEAEWEYAYRAGSSTAFYNGNCLGLDFANYNNKVPYGNCSIVGTANKKVVEVGKYPPNAFGLHDMAGNVWEWCDDWYGIYLPNLSKNPKGVDSVTAAAQNLGTATKIARGGSASYTEDYCRAAFRSRGKPDYSAIELGFRVVKETKTAKVENSNKPNPKSTDKNKKSDKDYTGNYTGRFGNYFIFLKIESIGTDNSVKGYNVVNGNRRKIKGVKTGKKFILSEPGDHEWDGVFEFTVENNIAKGVWKPYNNKIPTVIFSINKQD